MDVARKVCILARIAGMKIPSLDSIQVQSLIPEAIRDVDVETFMKRLGEFDGYFGELKAKAQAERQVLRYVGVIDLVNGKANVELKG